MTCESNRPEGNPIENRGTLQLRASIWGAVAYAAVASVSLHPMSPDRFSILGQVWVAIVLAVLSAIPVLVALVITDFIRGWIGRASLLVLSVPLGWIGLIILIVSYASVLEPVLGHEGWFTYFGETEFLHQLLQMLLSEIVLLAVTFTLWPWYRGGETLPRNPE